MSRKKRKLMIGNEEGMLLVTSMLVLVLLTIIGIAATSDSIIELTIAGNDRLHKKSFYMADGGTEWGHEVLEQNIACLTGFTALTDTRSVPSQTGGLWIDDVFIKNASLNMWLNSLPLASTSDDITTNDNWDMVLQDPNDFNGTSVDTSAPLTVVKVAGNASLAAGAAIQMAAGYEGKGKSIGMGGAVLEFSVNSRQLGENSSEANVCLGWRHTVGQEGECYY